MGSLKLLLRNGLDHTNWVQTFKILVVQLNYMQVISQHEYAKTCFKYQVWFILIAQNLVSIIKEIKGDVKN